MKFLKSKWGLTLSEVLITTSLISLFLVVIGEICFDGIKAFKKSRSRIETQQEAQISIDRLCRELNETYADTIVTMYSTENGGTAAHDAISFSTSRNDNEATGSQNIDPNTAKIIWFRNITYYKKANQTEFYRIVINKPASPGSQDPMALTVLNINNAINSNIAVTSKRKMAREIYNIYFDSMEKPFIKINVTARVKNAKGTYETTELTTMIKPIN